jgi:hypothetical protein
MYIVAIIVFKLKETGEAHLTGASLSCCMSNILYKIFVFYNLIVGTILVAYDVTIIHHHRTQTTEHLVPWPF